MAKIVDAAHIRPHADCSSPGRGPRIGHPRPPFRCLPNRALESITDQPEVGVVVLLGKPQRQRRRRAAGGGLPSAGPALMGITAYLQNGGTLEHAQHIAADQSPRTTKLYDRAKDEMGLTRLKCQPRSKRASSWSISPLCGSLSQPAGRKKRKPASPIIWTRSKKSGSPS